MPVDHVRIDSEALKAFEKALDNYVHELRRLNTSLINAQNGMYSCWKDSQYHDVSRIILDVNQRINIQLSKMEFLNEVVKKKRQILSRAED